MKEEFTFGIPQRMHGNNPVCPCCNEVVAAGAKRTERAGQILHDHCGVKFDAVMTMKPEIETMFSKLPARFFEGSDLQERLARTCTYESLRRIIAEFCKRLRDARSWLNGKVDEIATLLIAFGERTRMGNQIEAYLGA